jgi:hypothetical protein
MFCLSSRAFLLEKLYFHKDNRSIHVSVNAIVLAMSL